MRISGDVDAVNEVAAGLQSVSLDGQAGVASFSSMNIPGALEGVMLGNDIAAVLESLKENVDAKAENLRQVVRLMTDLDERWAASL